MNQLQQDIINLLEEKAPRLLLAGQIQEELKQTYHNVCVAIAHLRIRDEIVGNPATGYTLPQKEQTP